jgi:hypothetical protein
VRAVGEEPELPPLSGAPEEPEEPEPLDCAGAGGGGAELGAAEGDLLEGEADPLPEDAWVSAGLGAEAGGLEGPPNRTRRNAPTDTEVEPTATAGSFGFRSVQSGVTERSVWDTEASIPPPREKPSMILCSGTKTRRTAP